jgi:hypothetical protein
MPKLTRTTTAASLLALAAALALPGSARAGCTPAVTSDSTNSTCVGTNALLNNATSGTDTGQFNTAVGRDALRANTGGDSKHREW